MHTYHGLEQYADKLLLFFRLPIYSLLHKYATALWNISQAATICDKYYRKYAYRYFFIRGGISGGHRYVLSMWYICVCTYCAYSYIYCTCTIKYQWHIVTYWPSSVPFSAYRFFRFGRAQYYAFHTYHTYIAQYWTYTSHIAAYQKNIHIGGKVAPGLGEIGRSSELQPLHPPTHNLTTESPSTHYCPTPLTSLRRDLCE